MIRIFVGLLSDTLRAVAGLTGPGAEWLYSGESFCEASAFYMPA
jgi:hypothetical protein